MKPNLVVRIVAPVIAISVLPLIVGIYAAYKVQKTQKKVSTALDLDVRGVRAGEKLAIGIRDVRTALNHFVGEPNHPQHLAAAMDSRPEIERWIVEAQKAVDRPGEQKLVDRLRAGCSSFFTKLDALNRSKASANDRRARVQEINDTLNRELLAPATDYLDSNEKDIENSNAVNQEMAGGVLLGLLLLGVCGPVSGLVAGFGIARGYSRSIVRLSLPIQDAAGKLNEIVGPIIFSAQANLEEIEIVLHTIAAQIGNVVERLQESRREALRAEQLAAVGRMAAGIAHELRNPLMAMKILVQAAAERSPAVLEGRDLSVLEEEITRLEHSTDAFLDFARPPQIERRTFDVRTLIAQVMDLLSGQAERKGVRLECNLEQGRGVPIRADMVQIRQVLLNLFINSLEAVPAGGAVWLELAVHKQDATNGANPGWLMLRVCDNGPGIPADLGPKIFEPFVGTKPSGIGLGLSICKRIVESHDGEIRAENRAEGGAVFTVCLPLVTGSSPNPATVTVR